VRVFVSNENGFLLLLENEACFHVPNLSLYLTNDMQCPPRCRGGEKNKIKKEMTLELVSFVPCLFQRVETFTDMVNLFDIITVYG
jgi:hypothetical protein